jgi:hypothetical protein
VCVCEFVGLLWFTSLRQGRSDEGGLLTKELQFIHFVFLVWSVDHNCVSIMAISANAHRMIEAKRKQEQNYR